jgi:acid phosphatase
MLTTGQPLTLDDAFNEVVDDDNVVRELNARGKTWKAYLESLPAIGYLGGDQLPYVKRHNPFAYLSDVAKQPAQASKMVPFTEFAADLNGGQLANFSFIAPDVLNDAHTGTLQDADLWLHRNIDPLINSPVFRQDGLLIITFDEGNLTDMEHGGGRVATIIVSPKAKKKFASTTFYQHQSTLRLILQVLGITKFPGLAANAPAMNEFFQ